MVLVFDGTHFRIIVLHILVRYPAQILRLMNVMLSFLRLVRPVLLPVMKLVTSLSCKR